jgi:ABC-2 type transport system permease protein
MRNIWTIAKREYQHYFSSAIAYVVAFVILFVLGIIFTLIVRIAIDSAMNPYGAYAPDISPLTWYMAFLLLFATPALTMRLVSDEMRMGTMELLLTAPVRDWELILGKWLGAFLFVLMVIAITLIFPLLLNNMISEGLDQRQVLSSYLGVILVAGAFLAIGVGISALFSNQIAAFFVTFMTLLVLWWLIGFPAQYFPVGGDVFNYLNMGGHFDAMNMGTIKLSDLVFPLSLTLLGLFVGTTAVEMRRWR